MQINQKLKEYFSVEWREICQPPNLNMIEKHSFQGLLKMPQIYIKPPNLTKAEYDDDEMIENGIY